VHAHLTMDPAPVAERLRVMAELNVAAVVTAAFADRGETSAGSSRPGACRARPWTGRWRAGPVARGAWRKPWRPTSAPIGPC
jgi:hypothetical protein